MGRGDKRTKKGKIFAGSFGNARPQRKPSTESNSAKKEAKKSEKK